MYSAVHFGERSKENMPSAELMNCPLSIYFYTKRKLWPCSYVKSCVSWKVPKTLAFPTISFYVLKPLKRWIQTNKINKMGTVKKIDN